MTGAAVVLVAVGKKGRSCLDLHPCHVVDANGDVVFHTMEGVDVTVQDLCDLRLNVARGVAQDVARRRVEWRFAEPADACRRLG